MATVDCEWCTHRFCDGCENNKELQSAFAGLQMQGSRSRRPSRSADAGAYGRQFGRNVSATSGLVGSLETAPQVRSEPLEGNYCRPQVECMAGFLHLVPTNLADNWLGPTSRSLGTAIYIHTKY